MHAGHRVGDDVIVLAGKERHGDAELAPERARPLAAGEHDDVGADAPGFTGLVAPLELRDALAAAGLRHRAGDPRAFADLHAAIARALGERQRQVGRIGLAVAGQPHGTLEIGGGHDRVEIACLAGRDDVAGHPVGLCHRGGALQLHHAVGRARHRQRAALLPAGRKPRFRFEACVQVGRVADQPRHALVVAQLTDEPRRVPGRARRQPSLLEQHDVGLAERTQVVGDRAPHDPAPDHHDPRRLRRPDLRRQCLVCHSCLPGRSCSCSRASARPLRSEPFKSVLSDRCAVVP